jgi:hypothetical protein
MLREKLTDERVNLRQAVRMDRFHLSTCGVEIHRSSGLPLITVRWRRAGYAALSEAALAGGVRWISALCAGGASAERRVASISDSSESRTSTL